MECIIMYILLILGPKEDKRGESVLENIQSTV